MIAPRTKPSASRNWQHPKQKRYDPGDGFERASDYGQFVFSAPICSAFWTAATASAVPGTSTNAPDSPESRLKPRV
jgi:hypothetical protein